MNLNPDQYLATLREKSAQKNGANSERAEFIGWITDRINTGRRDTKYKPLTYGAIVHKVSHLKTADLRDFYFQCEKAENFSMCFFGRLKVKKYVL